MKLYRVLYNENMESNIQMQLNSKRVNTRTTTQYPGTPFMLVNSLVLNLNYSYMAETYV